MWALDITDHALQDHMWAQRGRSVVGVHVTRLFRNGHTDLLLELMIFVVVLVRFRSSTGGPVRMRPAPCSCWALLFNQDVPTASSATRPASRSLRVSVIGWSRSDAVTWGECGRGLACLATPGHTNTPSSSAPRMLRRSGGNGWRSRTEGNDARTHY
jgi:hypothetical protein